MIKCPNCNNTSIQLHTSLSRINNSVVERWKCKCGCVITKVYAEVMTYAHDKNGTLIYQEFAKEVL